MRPGGAPVPNFFVPMVQQGQQGQRPGGRRGGGVQQSQQPVPLMPQQVGGFPSQVYIILWIIFRFLITDLIIL